MTTANTQIEWADATWSPVTGGAKRIAGMPFPSVLCHPGRLTQPLCWRHPRRALVTSWGDLFHDDVPHAFIDKVLSVMALTPHHTYIVVTKRPARMLAYFDSLRDPAALYREKANAEWLLDILGDYTWHSTVDSVANYFRSRDNARRNLILMVSAEDQQTADERIPLLLRAPAATRGVLLEPLLGPVNIAQYITCECQACKTVGNSIDWIVVGTEIGPCARPTQTAWVADIISQCAETNVPVFVKQLHLDGDPARLSRNPSDWPPEFTVRQFPSAQE